MWDLETQCCVQTVVGHRCEIWSLAVLQRVSNSGETSALIMTGAADELLRGYRLSSSASATVEETKQQQQGAQKSSTAVTATITTSAVAAGDDDVMRVIEYHGCLERTASGGSDKCAGLCFNPAGNLLAAQSSGKVVEVFRIRDAAEAKKKCKRRLKRTEKKSEVADEKTEEGNVFSTALLVLSDEVEALPSHTIRCAARVRSFAFDPAYRTMHSSTGTSASHKECRGLISLINNTLEIYQIPYVDGSSGDEAAAPAKLSVIDIHGHKSDVRAIAVSGDGGTVATCSSESIKVQCYIVCVLFIAILSVYSECDLCKSH